MVLNSKSQVLILFQLNKFFVNVFLFKDLDADHYAMDKLKRRVLEYLAVRQLKNTLRGPILCFVGPPGVGKTSVGRSIAHTLGREFYRQVLFAAVIFFHFL